MTPEPIEHPMRPIENISHVEVERLHGLLFDIDDTVLTDGLLTLEAYSALFAMRKAGMRLIAATGRAAAWGEILAMQWPVDAVIAENGAVAFIKTQRSVRVLDWVDVHERRQRHGKLVRLASEIREHFPEMKLALDASMRRTDLAFDVGETERVEHKVVERAQAFAEARGARTSVSSIHFHVTFDSADKGSGGVRLLCRQFEEDATAARFRYAFIGDSGNDAAAFCAFHLGIGVQNIRGSFTRPPKYVTRAARGAGFAEAAKILVERRV